MNSQLVVLVTVQRFFCIAIANEHSTFKIVICPHIAIHTFSYRLRFVATNNNNDNGNKKFVTPILQIFTFEFCRRVVFDFFFCWKENVSRFQVRWMQHDQGKRRRSNKQWVPLQSTEVSEQGWATLLGWLGRISHKSGYYLYCKFWKFCRAKWAEKTQACQGTKLN